MLIHRFATTISVRAGLFILLAPLVTPSALHVVRAQTGSSRTQRSVAVAPPASAAAATPAVRGLYRQHCLKCHGADGKGSAARGLFPEIPDFTKRDWQRRQKEAHLVTSILDGKGTGMPSLAGKIGKDQARDLVKYIRNFAPPEKKAQEASPASDSFHERYRRLQEEWRELRRQFYKLAKEPLADSRIQQE
jgi:mono/diheme cytochrome c family protein